MGELKELAQLGGTVLTVLIFVNYLIKKEKDFNKYMIEKDQEFNKIIRNHLEHSNKVIEKNTEVMRKVAVNLKGLTDVIKRNSKR